MASAPVAPIVDIPLSLFSGMDPELNPADCPEGISPDNQDMIFLPGSTDSRPGLHGIFAQFAGGGPGKVYQKSYIQPNGFPLTLILDTNGQFWVEDVTFNPGIASPIAHTAPGLYAQSVTAFGREYIAVSDLLHGQDVPRQFDGTNVDRVSQDGPGQGPVITNFQPRSATLQNLGAPQTANISTITFGGLTTITYPHGNSIHYYTFFTVVTATPHGFSAGQQVTIAGSTSTPSVNGTWYMAAAGASQFTVNGYFPFPATNGGGGTATATASQTSLSRLNNIVTAVTSAAHGFQVGWQVQISGVANTNIGGGIEGISRDGSGVVHVETNQAHGLLPGAVIQINGVTDPDTTFNGTFTVTAVQAPNVFTYQQGGTVTASGSGTGNVQDIWNTTAFIQSVPSSTTFTYQQIGPTDSTTSSGAATIVGQIAPGVHECVLMFLTRQGYITAPSPPVQINANGGNQLALTNIAIGPPNVVARVLGFTGAGGANYFTLTATPQVNGQIVGTALIIPDNTSTTAIVDFSDTTLFAGIAIDVVGNDLFDQAVLGPCAGFFAYDGRLFSWGEYNKVQNFLNMGFCGGSNVEGWDTSGNSGGALIVGGPWNSGMVWQITGDGTGAQKGLLRQSAYQDYLGDAIASPNTRYGMRLWAQVSAPGLAGTLFLSFFSTSTGFSSVASVPVAGLSTVGAFIPLTVFGVALPATIPSDLKLAVYAQNMPHGALLTIGELEIIFTQNPYLDNLARASYVLNPEAFAQTTGTIGPEDDQSPIRCMSLQRNSVLLKTSGGTHIFQAADSEPDGWSVNQISRSVGAVSLRAGDPGRFGTGDAAEDWDLTFTKNGLYLFAGGEFWKVSQEMQPIVDSVNWAAQQTIFVKNDIGTRRAYIGLPTGSSPTPNLLLVMDYRELDTASQIASSPPVHISFTGKMICSDLTRKWSRWNVQANSAEVIIRPGNDRQMTFGGAGAGGNIYFLDSAKLTDDDYGQIFPYYTTYGFVNHEQEQALGLGSHRKLLKKVCAFATGVGNLAYIPLVDSLFNPLPADSPRQLTLNTSGPTALDQDLEWTTGISGERIFLKFFPTPLPGTTDVKMSLQKLIVTMTQNPIAVTRSSRL